MSGRSCSCGKVGCKVVDLGEDFSFIRNFFGILDGVLDFLECGNRDECEGKEIVK